jgi:hypothetical protein
MAMGLCHKEDYLQQVFSKKLDPKIFGLSTACVGLREVAKRMGDQQVVIASD